MTPIDTVTIRRIYIDDLDQIQHLYEHQIAADTDPFSQIQVSTKQLAFQMRKLRQQWLAEQRYFCFVATIPSPDQSEQLIGYIAAVLQTQASLFKIQSFASIGELWVEPEYRRRGIGEAMMKQLLNLIDQMGIEWITVQIPDGHEDVHDFFQKTGFSKSTIEMRCHLTDNP